VRAQKLTAHAPRHAAHCAVMLNDMTIVSATVAVLLLIGLFGVGGFAFGRYMRDRDKDDAPFGVIQAAAFGLVGLLLGFSFSLAVSRFDQRREITVQEANAIGTTALRVPLLDAADGRKMWGLLRAYSVARLDFAKAGTRPNAREEPGSRSHTLQVKMWALAMRAAAKDPHSTMVPLFIQTLNNAIDMAGEQAAALNAVIPGAVLAIVVGVILLAAALLGADFARLGRFEIGPFVLFAGMLALTLATILDLDRPQRGYIRVPVTPLQDVVQELELPYPGPASAH